MLRVVLHGLGVEHLSVVLAGVEILVVVLGEGDLQLVVAQLEIRHVVGGRLGRLILGALLFPLFVLLALLLQLLVRLLGLSCNVSGADLSAEDASLRPVAVVNAELHLLEDELGLLASGHGSECLDLQLAQDVGGALGVALALLDVG